MQGAGSETVFAMVMSSPRPGQQSVRNWPMAEPVPPATSMSRPSITMMTVMQGLEQLRLGLPLSLLDLVPQLSTCEYMECVATHNSGGEVLLKMQKTDTELILDLKGSAPGHSMLADKGEGWHCIINEINGDVYHHLPDGPLLMEPDLSLPDSIPLEGHTLHIRDSVEGETFPENEKPALDTVDATDIIVTSSNQIENLKEDVCATAEADSAAPDPPGTVEVAAIMIKTEGAESKDFPIEMTDAVTLDTSHNVAIETEAVTTEVTSMDTSLDVIVEAAVNSAAETATYSSDSLHYINVPEDGEMNLVPSTVQLVAEGSEAVDTDHWSQLQERDSLDLISTAEDGLELLPEKLPRITQDVLAYKCYMCTLQYTKRDILVRHLKNRHGIELKGQTSNIQTVVMRNAHICFICQAIAPNYEAIRKHLQRVHKTGYHLRTNRKAGTPGTQSPWCSICKKQYVSVDSLSMHVRHYHKDHPDFNEAVNYVQQLRDGLSKQQSKVLVTCPVCRYQCRGRRIFRHIKNLHPGLDESVLKQVRKSFNVEAKRVWNFNLEHQLEVVECPSCRTKMQRKNMSRHKSRCPGKPKDESEGGAKVQCPDCGKEVLQTYLPRHRKDRCAIKTEKPWDCQECDEMFATRYLLKIHIKTVHSSKTSDKNAGCGIKKTGKGGSRYCDICHREMTLSWSDMRAHKREVHGKVYDDGMDEAILKCSVCLGDVPGGPVKMQKHKKKEHSKSVVFCDICNEEMCNNSPNTLKAHLREAHGLDVPMNLFQCGLCENQFPRKSSLVWHISSVHGERDKKCPHCTKVFKSSSALKLHVTTLHMQIFRFSCTKCGKGFRRQPHLDQHLRTCMSKGGDATDTEGVAAADSAPDNSDDADSKSEMLLQLQGHLTEVADSEAVNTVVNADQSGEEGVESDGAVDGSTAKNHGVRPSVYTYVWDTLSSGETVLMKKVLEHGLVGEVEDGHENQQETTSVSDMVLKSADLF